VQTHFPRDGVNNKSKSRSWDRNNPNGTVASNYQRCFYVNILCGVTADQPIGPYIFPQHLTSDIWTNVLQDELPALLQNVPLQTR